MVNIIIIIKNIIRGPVEQRQTRSGRIIKMPNKYNDYVVNDIKIKKRGDVVM